MTSLSLFDEPTGVPGPRVVTLVRLAGEIARQVASIGSVSVEGEVHRPTTGRTGWVYFTLRDRAAQASVVVPRPRAGRSRIVAGERVRVVGALEWSSDRGSLQLRAEEVLPVGEGAIAALLAETRRRLESEGLTTRPRRPLPVLPELIGVVCGSDAAVRHDIESVVAERFPGYPVVFCETTVSGPGAAASIVEALRSLCRQPGMEVVILARGGGDATSLLPWSDENLCREVAAAAVPVVSAIGHEADRPLCDEVADLRCGTPSLAATAVLPDASALSGRLDQARRTAGAALVGRWGEARRGLAGVDPARALDSALAGAGERLGGAGRRLAGHHPRRRLEECRRRLAGPDWRRGAGEVLGRAAGRLEADRRHLGALDPARVLDRGYAVVTGPRGEVLRRSGDVAVGDAVAVRLAAGRIAATVTEVAGDATAGDATVGDAAVRDAVAR
ncbi:MAG: exodeoxyribonuclease VII large subunit [Actinomycetota bacterium]|nr:exodeoxyribonuclease VII large subunit [Actinomycetota bacterium]